MRRQKEKWIDIGFFLLLLALAGAVTFRLFYLQTTYGMAGRPEYHSDMKAYILNMQGLDSGYSFPYPVFFKLSAFFDFFLEPETAVALATLLLNMLSMIVVKLAFEYICGEALRRRFAGREWLAGVTLSLAAVSLHFVSMVYPPGNIYLPGIWRRYLGVFTPNPFHNATYMATRPFAIPAFLWFVKLLREYEDGCRLRDYIWFSVFLLLTTMTKPSFTIVLVGTAGLIMVYRLFRAGFRNFKPTLRLGLCFLPTFADLLYQYQGVFVPQPGEEGGIGIEFAAIWKLYSGNIPLAIGLAAGFPILVTLIHWKELRTDGVFRLSWQVYLMGLAMALLLYEKGFRKPDFNFSWGYIHGIYFVFFGALIVLLKATARRKGPVWLLALQWLAYGWHLVCGLYYFWTLSQGNMYYF